MSRSAKRKVAKRAKRVADTHAAVRDRRALRDFLLRLWQAAYRYERPQGRPLSLAKLASWLGGNGVQVSHSSLSRATTGATSAVSGQVYFALQRAPFGVLSKDQILAGEASELLALLDKALTAPATGSSPPVDLRTPRELSAREKLLLERALSAHRTAIPELDQSPTLFDLDSPGLARLRNEDLRVSDVRDFDPTTLPRAAGIRLILHSANSRYFEEIENEGDRVRFEAEWRAEKVPWDPPHR